MVEWRVRLILRRIEANAHVVRASRINILKFPEEETCTTAWTEWNEVNPPYHELIELPLRIHLGDLGGLA
jgi:hypothetical protein